MGKRELHWWVPMSHHVPEAKRELSEIFYPLAIIRIVLAFTAIFLVAAYLLPHSIPEFEFDWLAAYLKCLGGLVVILAMLCSLAFIPPMVTVSSKGVAILEGGQYTRWYLYSQLAELRIEDNGSTFPMLLLRTKSQREPKRYPIPSKIDLDDLQAVIDKHWPY